MFGFLRTRNTFAYDISADKGRICFGLNFTLSQKVERSQKHGCYPLKMNVFLYSKHHTCNVSIPAMTVFHIIFDILLYFYIIEPETFRV